MEQTIAVARWSPDAITTAERRPTGELKASGHPALRFLSSPPFAFFSPNLLISRQI